MPHARKKKLFMYAGFFSFILMIIMKVREKVFRKRDKRKIRRNENGNMKGMDGVL